MTLSRRRAVGAGVLGSALLLAGCAVPGQPAGPSVAAASEQTTVTNARVAELYDAWAQEAHSPIPRQQVVTLELLRQPLLDNVGEVPLQYSRYAMTQAAQQLKEVSGVSGEPSEALVDALEATYLLAAYTLIPKSDELLRSIAQEVADTTTVSPREGEIDVDALIATVTAASEAAVTAANQSQPGWFTAFNDANMFVSGSPEWLASE